MFASPDTASAFLRAEHGKLDAGEQCDPQVAGGSAVCDSNCKRTAYQTCSVSGNPCANSQFCTTFTLDQQAGTATRPVCSRGCVSDSDCPLAQGGSADVLREQRKRRQDLDGVSHALSFVRCPI